VPETDDFDVQAVGATDNWRAREIDEGTALKDEQGDQVKIFGLITCYICEV